MKKRSKLSSVGRVAVVGTGALGSELCRLLLEAEHEEVLLIDPDCLEERNLAMSALFRREQAHLGFAPGTSKVEAIRSIAESQGLAWEAIQAEIADVGWADLRRCRVLICCADSVLARVETAGTAKTLRLPMLDGAVASGGELAGRVAYFPVPTGDACYLCGLSEHRRAEVLGYAMSPSLGCMPGADFPSMTGVETTLRAVAARLFELLSELDRRLEQPAFALRLDIGAGTIEKVALTHSPSCPWHELPDPTELISLPFDEPVSSTLAGALQGSVLELFWPICLRTRCRVCGWAEPDRRRAALVRRRGVCSRCDTAGTLEPLDCVASFRAGDPEISLTPRQLGLPARHLYYRRPVAEGCERRTDTP